MSAHPGRWLVIAVVFLVAAALFGFLVGGLPGGAGLVICVVISLGALAQAYRVASRRRQHVLAHGMAQDSATRRQEQQRDQEERFRRRRRELELLLEEIDVPDVAAAEALLATMEQHTERLAHIEGELRGLGVQERSVRRLEESRDESADDTERASHALAGMGDLGREPAAFRQAAGRLVEQTQPARDRARSEEDQAQGRVGANLVDAELVADVAERLAAARERQAELQRRVLIYEATRQAIEVAEQATLKTAARYLEEHMGPAVERVTGGRYREVRVDDQSLAFRVRAPETGTLVDARQLSQGTSDQLFLAARLGLVRLVTMDRRPPIILDDSFVTFDEERAQRALELLKEVATEQGFQVLLLTCSDRFDAARRRAHRARCTAVRAEPPARRGGPGDRRRRFLRAGRPSRGRGRPLNQLLAPLLALLSAASWGAADFAGGITTRLSSAVVAVLLTQGIGLGLAAILLLVSAEPMPSQEALAWAAAAGVVGVLGMAFFYLALSRGTMGLVAPLTALLAAAIPASVGLLGGDDTGLLDLAGMVAALVAVVLISLPDRRLGAPVLPTFHGSRVP